MTEEARIERDSRPVVALINVSRAYPPFVTALRDVSLEIPAGQRVAILGPSGSGKSTLLGVLGLLDRPTSGHMALNGVDLTTLDERGTSRLRADSVGFVFQSFHLLPYLTARENVELSLAMKRVAKAERFDLAEAALVSVGLAHRADFRVTSLSGGEQQRVAVARALVRSPSLLLCDEPTGNLDSANAQVILELLAERRADRTTVVVTHNLDVAERLDRVVELRDGRVVADTTLVA